MKETILKHDDTQVILAHVQADYAKETKNRVETKSIVIIKTAEVLKNEYFKRKTDVVS